LSSRELPFGRGVAGLAALAVLALSGTAAPTALAATGSISGTVTGAPTHASVAEVEVCAWEYNKGEIVETKEHCTFSASNGYYEIDNLGEAEYLVVFWPRRQDQNYIPDTYDPDNQWPGEPVTVGTGPVTGVDVELPEGGSIKGQVTDEVGGEPLMGVSVCVTPQYENTTPRCVVTNAEGQYEIVGLTTHNYTVEFSPEQSGLHYFGEHYDNQRFGNGHLPTPVSVTAGSITTGIDVALEPSAEIRGVVTAAADGRPLGDILVCIAPALSFPNPRSLEEFQCSRTSGAGTYFIPGLEGGQYKVLFSPELREYIQYIPPLKPDEDGFPTRFWNEKASLWEADVLTLVAPTLVTGIDARLGPGPPFPLTSPSPPPSTMPAPALNPKCKRGRHLRIVRGMRRCVRRHPRKDGRHQSRHAGARN
jgi:hypothetical protein